MKKVDKKPVTNKVANNKLKEQIINKAVQELLTVPKQSSDTLATYFKYFKETESLDEIDLIARDLESWSEKPTSIVFWDFLDEYSIPENIFYEWVKEYPDLKKVHENTMKRIGSRRLKLAMFKGAECNDKFIFNTLRKYSSEHREIYDEDIKNKRMLDHESERVTVIIKDLKEIKSNE